VRRISPWIALPLGAAASTALGFWVGKPWLLPLLGAAVPIPLFLKCIRESRPSQAAGWVLYWCIPQSIAVGLAVFLFPERAADVVWRGPAYAAEMLHYIRTGQGAEGSPRLFLPIHARHFALLCVSSFLTFGAGGLVLGTVLLNYMNFYVAELTRQAAMPALAAVVGWPVWAVFRVVGFTLLGAAFAQVSWHLWSKWRGRVITRPLAMKLFYLGLGCVLLDALLKALLAPAWRGLLVGALASS